MMHGYMCASDSTGYLYLSHTVEGICCEKGVRCLPPQELFVSSNKDHAEMGIVPIVAAMYRSVCLRAMISFVAPGHPTLKYQNFV